VNNLSLSEVILSDIPWFVNICLSNRLAICRASMVSVVGIIYAYLVSLSTTTIIISFPSEIGNFVMKSIVIHSYSCISTSDFSISLYSACRDGLFR
jgi:hypothetical protein